MIAPFVLGTGLGWFFSHWTELFPKETKLSEAMLFLGASLCITAFPMLARIIHFKGLAGTLMGTVAIGAGAIDDAMAWCLLAVVLASFDSNLSHASWSIAGGVLFVLVALLVVRPLLDRCKRWWIAKDETLTESGLVMGLVVKASIACSFWCFCYGSMYTPRSYCQRVDREDSAIGSCVTIADIFYLFRPQHQDWFARYHLPLGNVWIGSFCSGCR